MCPGRLRIIPFRTDAWVSAFFAEAFAEWAMMCIDGVQGDVVFPRLPQRTRGRWGISGLTGALFREITPESRVRQEMA
jgi:hypothetical protein